MTVPTLISRRDLVHWPFESHAPLARCDAPRFPSDITTSTDYWIRVHRTAMACRFEVTLAGEDACWVPTARAALDGVDAVESRLTVFRDSSEVVRLNRAAASGPIAVDEDLFAIVRLCQELHLDTGGAFDVTSAPLSRCWGFLRRECRLPAADEIAAVMRSVGMQHVTIEPSGRLIAFDREHVELNFGAIGKGWALDRVAEMLETAGVARALVSAGGSSIRTVGTAQSFGQGDAWGWPISLTSLRVDQPLAHVWLRTGALGTSGAGVQFFEVDGKRYGHVIDPRTGWPADGALSVSVIATDAARADALSTAFFVGGLDLARRYCAAHPSVLVVFTPNDEPHCPIIVGDFAGADVTVHP